jgi:hypothetical protein
MASQLTGALRDLDHRRDVGDHRAPGARDLDLHSAARDLAAHAQHVLERALARPWKTDVGLVDAQVFHQVQDLELVLDRGILHRRVLQAVAQGLVEEGVSLGDEAALAVDLVPVVDELGGSRVRRAAFRGVVGHV